MSTAIFLTVIIVHGTRFHLTAFKRAWLRARHYTPRHSLPQPAAVPLSFTQIWPLH